MRRFYFALLPWGVFDITLRSAGLDVIWGASVALVTTFVLLSLVYPFSVGPLDMVSLVIFTVFLFVALGDHGGDGIRESARALATGALGLVFLGSLIVVPCTIRYTREVTAPRYWSRKEFRTFNVRLSLAWAATCFVIAGLDVLAATNHSPVVKTLCNWMFPLGLLVTVCVFTSTSLARHFDADQPTVRELVEVIDNEISSVSTRSRPRHWHLQIYRDDSSRR